MNIERSTSNVQLSRGGKWRRSPHLNPLPYTTTASHTTRFPPRGEARICRRQGNDRTRAHQICHSTKRTHRFFEIFLMQVIHYLLIATEIVGRNRWVRFGKRTHREGVLRGIEATCNAQRSTFNVQGEDGKAGQARYPDDRHRVRQFRREISGMDGAIYLQIRIAN